MTKTWRGTMDSVEVATDTHMLKTKQWDEYVPNV
jgi:hypothetical protein